MDGATKSSKGYPYPEFYDEQGFAVNNLLFLDDWGFEYRWVNIVNRGDTENYPATVLIERIPPHWLQDMRSRYFALPFHDWYCSGDKGKSVLALPPEEVRTENILPLDHTIVGLGTDKLIGSLWQHRSGRFYRITHVANVYSERKLSPTIIYTNISNNEYYAGVAADWLRRMTLVVEGLDSTPSIYDKPYISPVARYDTRKGYEVFEHPPQLVITHPQTGRRITSPVSIEYYGALNVVLEQISAYVARRAK